MTKTDKIFKPSVQIPTFIIYIAKSLQLVSNALTTHFAAKLFSTPIKYKTPKREFGMIDNSVKNRLFIPAVGKNIMVYEYGKSDKKVLLVHGWAGRGTQMVKIADSLIKKGYQTISFDAPAHGQSEGKTALMPDFITCILELEKKYGKFEAIIGHSLGGMATLSALKKGLVVKKAVIIGSGDIVKDIIDNFIRDLKVKPIIGKLLSDKFEKMSGYSMDSLSGYQSAKSVVLPVLVIHDAQDGDVPVKCAFHIAEHLKQHEIMITKGLGHRKILGDSKVIERTINFIQA